LITLASEAGYEPPLSIPQRCCGEQLQEIKALLGKIKDVHRHEKLQAIYWLKTQTVETVSSIAV
ncbi:hypothetical protein QUA81_28135, partial [Microcoleus sp. F6_B4]